MDSPLPRPLHVPLQALPDPWLASRGIRISVKREDLIDPYLSGNKWRKLRYVLADAARQNAGALLTFGGAYSNHLMATAAAAARMGVGSIGVVRGEETSPLNPTLQYCQRQGMRLRYLSREAYRHKRLPEIWEPLLAQYASLRPYLIPEGGTAELALPGCAEMIDDLAGLDYDGVAVACGTGGTLAGLVAGLGGQKHVWGFPVLKGGEFLGEDIAELLRRGMGSVPGNWSLHGDYHFGGYAKQKPELLQFMRQFGQMNGIALERIYTGKMFYGLYDLASKGFFAPGTHIVAIHTGGMQGGLMALQG
jgi:1-aminocyclopropane-1-carboxylate deaminase/D-cysteine desulfhydrase-like pyridoxal-dependent ACC family enzyme